MNKKFIEDPNTKDDFDKISWCIHVAQEISGSKVERETVLESFESFNVDISELERDRILSMVKWIYADIFLVK